MGARRPTRVSKGASGFSALALNGIMVGSSGVSQAVGRFLAMLIREGR